MLYYVEIPRYEITPPCMSLLAHLATTLKVYPLPQGKTRYPLYRRLGGPQGRSGRAENLVPVGIRSRTVQPVVSRYSDWATRPTHTHTHIYIYIYIYTHMCVCVCVYTNTIYFDTNTYALPTVDHCIDTVLSYNSNWTFTWIIAFWMYKLSCEDQAWPKHAGVGWDVGTVCTYQSRGPLNPLIAGNVFPTVQRCAVRTPFARNRTAGKTEIRSSFENLWMSSIYGDIYRHCHHHHLPPWIRTFDLFRHRRVTIFSWGVHCLFFCTRSFVIWSADIRGCASLLMSIWFSFGRLPARPQNPHSLRTSLSLLVWLLSYGLCGLGGPTRNI